ncbi:hypothetical protein C8F04DRAFT_1184323 [Mycena alexandri]|uniref:Uncharacterized protein n=1 Tax=Mycena alexandri TaxID=1745969 RepID=A0AAD6SUJ2_9AGAR|nr:hypothetical protein C8F04DRAFT_1184323 [Mycena alexandri]
MNHFANSQNQSAAHLSTPPAAVTNPCNKVPGIWFMKVGGNSPTDVDFVIAPEFAAAWGISFAFLSVGLSLADWHVLDALPTTAEILATTWADLQPKWPTALFVDLNIGRPDGATWVPNTASPFAPLELTNYIRRGINTVRFRQPASMMEHTFVLYAFPRDLLPNAAVPDIFPFPSTSVQRGSTTQHASPIPQTWNHRPSDPAAQHLYASHQLPPPSQPIPPPAQGWSQREPYGPPHQHWNHPAAAHDPPARLNPVSLHGLGLPDFNGTGGLPQPVAINIVGALSVDHEPFIIKVLQGRLSDGRTHRQALERLHGLAGYSANAWKDYYLDNQERMDIAVGTHKTSTRSSATLSSPTSPSESSSAPPGILKKSAPKYRSSLSPAASYSHLPPSGPSKGPRRARKPLPVATSSHLTLSGASRGLRKGRQTINSITAPQPVYSARLPPPNAEIRIPDPPSRSPSPPTEVDDRLLDTLHDPGVHIGQRTMICLIRSLHRCKRMHEIVWGLRMLLGVQTGLSGGLFVRIEVN